MKKHGLADTYVKLVRHCPRCRAHRYHGATRTKKEGRHVVTVSCAECGHSWRGRYKRDEWEGDQ